MSSCCPRFSFGAPKKQNVSGRRSARAAAATPRSQKDCPTWGGESAMNGSGPKKVQLPAPATNHQEQQRLQHLPQHQHHQQQQQQRKPQATRTPSDRYSSSGGRGGVVVGRRAEVIGSAGKARLYRTYCEQRGADYDREYRRHGGKETLARVGLING